MKADGFSLDDKRQQVEENDIPDILERWKNRELENNRKRTDQSFYVPVDEIQKNDYDLSINKYKEVEYIAKEYSPTAEIMSKIEQLNEEFTNDFAKLKIILD